jgi:hypothetical protein
MVSSSVFVTMNHQSYASMNLELKFHYYNRYDGDIELKTDAEMARDLFLYRESVKPVVDRLQKFSIVVGSVWIASCIGLNAAFSTKPIFNEYDPELLKTLNYDDKRANVAAELSNGRPTYCESRYYRAIANGGQGKLIRDSYGITIFVKSLILFISRH